MRPRGGAELVRTLALAQHAKPTTAIARRTPTLLPLGSYTYLPSASSRRYYSRDPLQAEHEANTVRGNRSARLRSEEQSKQHGQGNTDGPNGDGSYKGKFSTCGCSFHD